jgi:hypothetical protein
MPWVETLTMMIVSPISKAMLMTGFWQLLVLYLQEATGEPTGPEDPRWPRF